MKANLAILILMAAFSNLCPAKVANPLILQRADPWIIKHENGQYYFTATVPTYDRIELRRSNSLAGLSCAEPKTIWQRHASGPMSHHIWAPELHFIDGSWFIYFAAGRADDIWAIRMYVLENRSANPLDGEWIEHGKIETPWDSFALDATTFSQDGQRYLIWAQKETGSTANTALWIARLKNPWTIDGDPVKLSEPEFAWEKQLFEVNEGPAVLQRNGRIFVSYSASGTNHHYAMGLLWADVRDNLLLPDSWHKSAEPVFRTSEESGIFGPGHNSFTTDEDGRDLLVYHARNYREISGDPLTDPNRHTRVQPFAWNASGLPDFGRPAGETPGKLAGQPLYRDPVFDGAADPVVIWNPDRGRWWMFYTNRRANAQGLSGVAWVHGTRIGIAESCDGGATWQYLGTANIDLPEAIGGSEPTHWAPEVITAPNGAHHMYLTVVPGVFENWNHPRSIVHLTSRNLRDWQFESVLDLATDRVIDACVLQLPDGTWRMWYNNERDGKSIYFADSPDLYRWSDRAKVVGDRPGEGPKVFFWKNRYWMITDVWKGLGVYSSCDAREWTLQQGANLLQSPGTGKDDATFGHHADVVVQGERAFLFFFTHPGRTSSDLPDTVETRRSSIQVAELQYHDGRLAVDRDASVELKLNPIRGLDKAD